MVVVVVVEVVLAVRVMGVIVVVMVVMVHNQLQHHHVIRVLFLVVLILLLRPGIYQGVCGIAGKLSERHPRRCRAGSAMPKDRLKQMERGTHKAQDPDLVLYIRTPLRPRELLTLLLSLQSLILSCWVLLSLPVSREALRDIWTSSYGFHRPSGIHWGRFG